MKAVDRLAGVYHFLFDKTPRSIPQVPPKPRRQNPWLKDGKAIVARIKASNDLRQSIDRAIAALGPLTPTISRGDTVLVKPNFNSDDPYPASTDLPFLKAMIEILLELGARVIIGESSGGVWRPTTNVFRKSGVYDLARSLGVKLVAFEENPKDWVRIPIKGEYLHIAVMPRSAYEADRLVYLPCMKTHMLARYSGALKLAFGFVDPGERRAFHLGHLEAKLAEVNLCWQPDLIVMDARKAFVSGGPDHGEIVEPGLILASGDPVAIDVEAVSVLLGYHAKNRLTDDPWQLPQIATAVKHGLGVGKDGYVVIA